MVPTEGTKSVWGVLYEIPRSDEVKLDKQKGVNNADPKYAKIKVVVSDIVHMRTYEAMSYNIRETKRKRSDGQVQRYAPSSQYKRCILKGATENDLPPQYLAFLRSIRDNGNPYRRKSLGSVCD